LENEMANEWSNQRQDRIEDSDKRSAAILASALVAGGHTSPMATNVDMAAKQAVEIYFAVLGELQKLRAPSNA